MAELTAYPGKWDPDPDWFGTVVNGTLTGGHCPVCGQERIEGIVFDIEERVIKIEFKKWVEHYDDGIWLVKPKIIPMDVRCWFHAECWDIYARRTGGA